MFPDPVISPFFIRRAVNLFSRPVRYWQVLRASIQLTLFASFNLKKLNFRSPESSRDGTAPTS